MAAHRKDLDDSTIIDLYLQGKSSTEIAKQFGTSHRTILLRLKKHTHVHNLIPFKSILNRIIIQNYPLSPVDDADKLYEIAVKDKELNNPNNLITVCSMCHHKIHGQL